MGPRRHAPAERPTSGDSYTPADIWGYPDGTGPRTVDSHAFGFTRLRLGVHAFMVWLAGVLTLVLAALVVARGRLLPQAVAVATAAFVLAFALANPDAIVARHNLERAADTGRVDLAYLAGLSADAVPVLAASRPAAAHPELARQADRLAEPDGWTGWNVARDRARRALRR